MHTPIHRWIRSGSRLGARTRVRLARRPWLVWAGVAVATFLLVGVARRPAADAAAARAQWGTTRSVLVATAAVPVGTPVREARLATRALPAALVPHEALTDAPPDALIVRELQAGEIVVAPDLGTGDARFALVPAGHVVMALARPSAMVPARAGDHVLVVGDPAAGAPVPAVVIEVSAGAVLIAVTPEGAVALAPVALASSDSVAIVLQGGPATVEKS